MNVNETTCLIGGICAVIGILLLVGLILLIRNIIRSVKRKKEIARRRAEAEQSIAMILQQGSLSEVDSCPIILQKGEIAVWVEPSTLYETRAVRRTRNGVTSSFQKWQDISHGNLVITTKRLVFDGTGANRNILLNKLISVQSQPDGAIFRIGSSSRQKEMAFSSRNSFLIAWIVNTLAES